MRALDHLVAARLARVEVPAALWRKHRTGELGAEHAATLVRAFELDWLRLPPSGRRFAVVALTDEVLNERTDMASAQ